MNSIIIPTLNQEENMAVCLASTQKAPKVERIVEDGASKDRTLEIARSCGAKVLRGSVGRAGQMNAGVESAKGDFLIFLHADTRSPEGFSQIIRHMMTLPEIVAGAFEFRLDVTSPGFRFIEWAANWRSCVLQFSYGDQALFVGSALFREIDGREICQSWRIINLSRRLKKKGGFLQSRIPP